MTTIRNSTSSSNDAAQSLYGKASQSGIAGNSSATAALRTAEKRIQGEVDNTTTLLSSVGKLKSSVADTKSAAHSLSAFSTTTTADEMKSSITKFVTAFNNSVAASSSVFKMSSGSSLSGPAGVGGDLKRAVNGDITMADALRKWGVTVQSDGTLAFDSEKFDTQQTKDEGAAAVFQKLGQAIDNVATKELATGGAVGRSLTSLNKRADLLQAQQDTVVKALQTDASTDTDDTDSKTSAAASTLDAAKSQQNSLFDILQADSSDEKTDANTQASNAALQSYLSVLKQK